MTQDAWQATACILCTCNCGLKVQLNAEGTDIARIKGDENHPASQGYVCNKASRISYYQHGADRLSSPKRRRADGTYEDIDWPTAIAEISERLRSVRDTHGGERIFYYGGGGQGNHLPGAYARSTLAALGVRWRSNALAQEKTGEFWVAQRMFGGWPHGDFEHAEVAVFLGKNPWQSHGVQRARATLRDISKDPNRTLIVIDPRRTETADLADIHLAVRPGRDAWLLAGMIAVLVQEDLIDRPWLLEHTRGAEAVIAVFRSVDVQRCASACGVAADTLAATARCIGRASSVAVLEDLGVQMNRHSTLVSYLQRLLWVLTGNFGRPGTHYTARGLGGIGNGVERGRSPVLGERIIAGLVPCNIIPDEVLSSHPNRYRAMIIESANPVHSLADSAKWRQAMRALECSVVIDVAMTETARQADYVLPATSQYEKAEATFFNFEFPDNFFHVRAPLFAPRDGALDEAEIHYRLVHSLGALPDGVDASLNRALEEGGREAFQAQVFTLLAEQPTLADFAPVLLYRTLGRTLPEGMRNAATLWALAHQHALGHRESLERAGFAGEGMALGEALFDAMLSSPSGMVVSSEGWESVWARVPGGQIELALPELLAEAETLPHTVPEETSQAYPLLLAAGERRSFTANTIIRDPAWRRKDGEGALRMHPEDAARINLGERSQARVISASGSAEVTVTLDERMYRGQVSLPNGMGLSYAYVDGTQRTVGAAPNELTSTDLRDAYAGTPWHKTVPVRVEAM